MTVITGERLANVGIDAVALKPSEVDVERAHKLDVQTVTIDYEGHEHVPTPAAFDRLAEQFDVRATVPVRADGFDPLGDDSVRATLPESVGEVLVAGHPAYLEQDERKRAIAPRLGAAVDESIDPWVGSEGVERIALATGQTQFELLSRSTIRDVRALRDAGFDGKIAVYAPTALTDDEDTVLDAVGEYTGRRGPVRAALPDDCPHDSTIEGDPRETLLEACCDYALVGIRDTVSHRVDCLREAGVDHIVAYPARGLDSLGA
ncbi:luciferase [Halovenus rubra]|uniref:Luciferase n=2 Tax=Halovenus rubra TaxID=869890 RepID=A0ABD5XAA7_9EURY|nr:luciferase [Halovenus rubra]